MGFENGHKLSKGRTKGSQNKLTQESKQLLKDLLFNPIQLREDFNSLDVNGRMEFRCRMAKYVMPEQKHIEFDETNYERNSIDFKDLISKIRMKGFD